MNPIQKYQEFIYSCKAMNDRYEKEISEISERNIPEETKSFMISNRMEYIEKNNEVIDELKKFIEKAANTLE